MTNKCPKCRAEPEEINAIINEPDLPTAWMCGSWLNAPDCSAPGFIQSDDCARRCRIDELEEQVNRLTNALHAAKAHPEFSYLVAPIGGMEHARKVSPLVMDAHGWERNEESETPESKTVDEHWRRRKQQ